MTLTELLKKYKFNFRETTQISGTVEMVFTPELHEDLNLAGAINRQDAWSRSNPAPGAIIYDTWFADNKNHPDYGKKICEILVTKEQLP